MYLSESVDWLTLIALLSVLIVLVLGLNRNGSESPFCNFTNTVPPALTVTSKSELSTFSSASVAAALVSINISSLSLTMNLTVALVSTAN